MNIEAIANKIAPNTIENEFLHLKIFEALQIKPLPERLNFLQKTIAAEKEKAAAPVMVTPTIRTVNINGKDIDLGLPEKIRQHPNAKLIRQCESELKRVNDLLYITNIAADYEGIKSEAERAYYLQYAKEGQTATGYKAPQHYTPAEIAKIIAAAIDEIDNPAMDILEINNPATGLPLLKWNAAENSLYTLFYDLLDKGVITWNGKANEGAKMEIVRLLTGYFVNGEGERLSPETIKQALKPGTAKAKKRVDISGLILPAKKRTRKR